MCSANVKLKKVSIITKNLLVKKKEISVNGCYTVCRLGGFAKALNVGDLSELFKWGFCIYILLGPPGCAQVFPYLSPGLLDFFGGMKTTNKPHESQLHTRPTECPHSRGELIDASRGYTFIFNN